MARVDVLGVGPAPSLMSAIAAARILSALRRHRRASRDQLAQFQDTHLRRLIALAYDNVPYYRALLDRHGIRPERIRTIADLPLIPVTAKRDLQRASPGELVARGLDPSRLIALRTSGSSGELLTVRRTWLEERLASAFRLRAFRAFGLRARDMRVGLRVGLGTVTPNDPRNWEGLQRLPRSLGLYPDHPGPHARLLADARWPPLPPV